MGIFAGKFVHEGSGHGPDRRIGRTQTPQPCAGQQAFAACLILLFSGFACFAEPLRVATWHAELKRDGPGLLLRDILKDDDPGIAIAVETIASAAADVLLLTSFDWDLELAALQAFADRLTQAGSPYPHLFTLRPNSGMPTGLDMDGDGRLGGRGDAQGYGRFAGHGGMAILSRHPIDQARVRDLSSLLWTEMPGAQLPAVDGEPFPSEAAQKVQRLSSVGHWDVPILLAYAAGNPVFDGPEDRNGLRNHDENILWKQYITENLDSDPPDAPVIIIGNANLDPTDGEGLHEAIRTLLNDPRVQDPEPQSHGGAEASELQGGVNDIQQGHPALDTVDWRDETGPGNLRVSYVLPDRRLTVTDAGVLWPERNAPLRHLIEGPEASRHRLVWVDLAMPD